MKSFKTFALVVVFELVGCRKTEVAETPARPTEQPAAPPEAPPVQKQAKPNAEIRENRELRVGDRLVVKSPEHEGWTDLAISPNGKWATIVATYPFDAAGTRSENYYLVVNLETGETIYHFDAQERFKLKAQALAYEGWKENEPATLKIFLDGDSRDDRHGEVSL